MFRIDQIMTATQFIRSFREVTAFLSRNPEPLLITPINGRFLVIMDGELFEGLMDARAQLSPDQSKVTATDRYDFKS